MRNSIRSSFVALTATIVLSLLVSTAAARSLRVNEQRFDLVWQRFGIFGGGRTVECRLTLEGSFHSATMSKVERALIGLISRIAAGTETCTGGTATFLRETLPWHVRYDGFRGLLPRMKAVKLKILLWSVAIRPSGSLTCLLRTSEENPGNFIAELEEEGEVLEVNAETGAEIPLTGEGGLCIFGGSAHFGGGATLRKLGRAERVNIRLI